MQLATRGQANQGTNVHPKYRSSPSRSRPVPVSVPDSRLSSSSVTRRATSVSVSRLPRKLPLLFVPLSSSPSSALSPSVVASGVPTLVSLTLCPSRRAESAVPLPSEYVENTSRNLVRTTNTNQIRSLSLPLVVPRLSHLLLSNVSYNSPVSRMLTPLLPVRPRPSRTP